MTWPVAVQLPTGSDNPAAFSERREARWTPLNRGSHRQRLREHTEGFEASGHNAQPEDVPVMIDQVGVMNLVGNR